MRGILFSFSSVSLVGCQAELANQQALLNEVLNSLNNASEDTRNLAADSEDIEEEYEEIDISD